MDEELELNTLHRLRKHSARLILEEHGSCEVPAGCGGLVLRWLNPAQECYLLFTVYPGAAGLQVFLDGKKLESTALTVPLGRHLLAIHTPESNLVMVAVQKNLKPDPVTVIVSAADHNWRGINRQPADNWAQPDFQENWPILGEVACQAKEWRKERLEKLGACPIGLPSGPLWLRREFEITE